MEQIIETPAANADAGNVAAPEGVAAPTIEGSVEPATPNEPATNIPAEPTSEPDVTTTKAFSDRLNKMVSEHEKSLWDKVNPVIAKLGGTRPDGQPIQTFEDLQAALEAQAMQEEAQKQNVPVEVLSRLTQAEKDAQSTREELQQLKREKEIAQEAVDLSKDEKWGDFFKAHETEIRNVADKVKCDLGTAKLLVYDKVGPSKVDEKAIGDKAIQEFLDKKRTLNKPIEGGGATPVTVVQTPKTYAEAMEGSRAFLRSLREQT